MSKRSKISITTELYFSQGGKCFYCGEKCILAKGNTERDLLHNKIRNRKTATIEHLYPKTDLRRLITQTTGLKHLRMACLGCNNTLGNACSDIANPFLAERYFNKTLFVDLLNGLYDNSFIM